MKHPPHLPVSKAIVVAILLCCVFGIFAGQRKGDTSRQPISSQARNAARQAVASVGLVLVRNGGDPSQPRPRGSAVLVSRDGLLATNYHVISEDKTGNLFDDIYVALTNTAATAEPANRFRVKIIAVAPAYDLAILRIVAVGDNRPLPLNLTFPALSLGDSRSIKLLDDLVIIGFPQTGGPSATVNIGVVEGKDEVNHWIKTDARFIHGNSGGAAVNAKGELIGIPTKVIIDTKKIDKDGDGFPDEEVPLGAVGFLRPAYLLKELIERAKGVDTKGVNITPIRPPTVPPQQGTPVESDSELILRGMVKSATTGKPIAGARVGLLPLGASEVKAENILSWGGTNGEGKFAMNKPVASGRYIFRAKAFAHEPYSREIEIKPGATEITIELRPEAHNQ